MRIAILTRVRPDPRGDADERRCHTALSEVAALGHDLLVLSHWTGRPIDDPQLGRRTRVIYPFRRFAAWEWPRAWAALYEFDPEVLHCLMDRETSWWSAEWIAPTSADFVNLVREQVRSVQTREEREQRESPLSLSRTRVPALLSVGPTVAESTASATTRIPRRMSLWPITKRRDRREVWISLGYQGVETDWLAGSHLAPTYRSAAPESPQHNHASGAPVSPEASEIISPGSAPRATLHFLTNPGEMRVLAEKRELDHWLGPLALHTEVHFACSLHRRELPKSARDRWVFWEAHHDTHSQALGARMKLSQLDDHDGHRLFVLASSTALTASPELRSRHLQLLRQASIVWTPQSAAESVRRELRRAGLLARVRPIQDLDWPHALYREALRPSIHPESDSSSIRSEDSDLGGNRISRLYAWLAHPQAHRPSSNLGQ